MPHILTDATKSEEHLYFRHKNSRSLVTHEASTEHKEKQPQKTERQHTKAHFSLSAIFSTLHLCDECNSVWSHTHKAAEESSN